jgi:ketosteroid isomerase-like protein
MGRRKVTTRPSTNVELVRSIYAAWERGDFSSWAHPEIEYVIADGPAPGTWTGLAAMAAGFRDFLSAWEDFHPAAEEFRQLNDERVLVLQRYRGRGKASALEIEQMRGEGAALFKIDSGKVIRFVHYFDRGRALADLGLAPEGDAA